MGAVADILNTTMGSVIVSIIIGLGLAALFRKVCDDKKCVVVKAPNSEEIERYYYKVQDDCYKYTPESVSCGKKS